MQKDYCNLYFLDSFSSKVKKKEYFNFSAYRKVCREAIRKQGKELIKEITFIDHHTCHAYYAAKAADIKKPKFAVLTLDSEGDGYNQTLWINHSNKLTKIYHQFIKNIFLKNEFNK